MKILIKNTLIITMDKDNEIIDKGYVLIKDKKIVKVDSGEYEGKLEEVKVIDGNNYCVMPGLINCHTHASMTLLRGVGEGLPLMRWLKEKIWPMEAKFTEKHIRIGTEIACLEMFRSGTTTFNDMYFMEQYVLDVVRNYGMRAVLGLSIIGDKWEEQIKQTIDLIDIIDNDKSGLMKVMFAPHSPYTLNYDALKQVGQLAKEYKKDIHIHISETKDEVNIIKDKYNKTTCELLLDTGIFNSKVVGAHCIHLTDSDINIMKENNVSAVYNPQSNMKLASGMARIVEMNETGINVCIGTDGTSSNNNLNMFEEMETGALLQKLKYNDATKLDGKTMLKMATINGAKALGIEKVGMLKEGYKADMIMVNLNKPNMVPNNDIYSNLVFSANGSEVEYVIVDGNIIMEKGEFTRIDEEKVLFECNNISKTLI
ncbi:amidohydrolase [Haloimpatiens sp. FM7330]|uniref:amidohydrolase n=1 Tax=Haloimpatiens sp. FM7330 TaxID=3298610 RepID=UPI00362B8FAE